MALTEQLSVEHHHLNCFFLSKKSQISSTLFFNFFEQVTLATVVAKTQIATDVLRTDCAVINTMAASNAK